MQQKQRFHNQPLWYAKTATLGFYPRFSFPTLVKVMAWCLPSPSHYLNQYWLIISNVMWYSHEDSFTGNIQDIYPWYDLKITNMRPQTHLQGTVWRHRTGSTPTQAMACCLMAPSHYLNQRWLIISDVLWHSPEDDLIGNTYRQTSNISRTLVGNTNCWSLRCSWGIACRCYSNRNFILDLTPGFNIMHQDNCKTRREKLSFGVWRLML